MTEPGPVNIGTLLPTLRASHERLVSVLAPLSDDEVAGQSYDDDWTIAQVASHIGSGAEIFAAIVDAGRTGQLAPGPDEMRPIWAVWDAKAPGDQARDAVVSNAELLEIFEAASGEQPEFTMALFGRDRSFSDIARMRLGEHAVHTWDIAVAVDPAAVVSADAIELLVDNLGDLVKRCGTWSAEPLTVGVVTHDPHREFTLDLTPDGVTVAAGAPAAAAARIALPVEAFVRLTYGRLDADHTPSGIESDGIDLDLLRATFPGV